MFLSTHELEHGRHVARLHRRRRRAYAPTSNTASHDTHEKINPWVSFCSLIWVWGSTWRPSAAELRYEARTNALNISSTPTAHAHAERHPAKLYGFHAISFKRMVNFMHRHFHALFQLYEFVILVEK